MASNPDFVQYVVEQCSGAGVVSVRKMFGDYGLYCISNTERDNDMAVPKIVGLISDNALYIKPTDAGKLLLRSEVMRPPYEGAKPYCYIEEVDDHDYLSALVRATCDALPEPTPKKKRANSKTSLPMNRG